jgi:hypothetical protein
MAILDSNARGSVDTFDGRRRDIWVATGTERRLTLFKPGKLYCPRGHKVSETEKVLEGSGLRHCSKKTPATGTGDKRGHEPPCDTWIYIIAGFRTFDGEDPSSIQIAVEVTPAEVQHLTRENLGTLAAAEYLGLLAWTRR